MIGKVDPKLVPLAFGVLDAFLIASGLNARSHPRHALLGNLVRLDEVQHVQNALLHRDLDLMARDVKLVHLAGAGLLKMKKASNDLRVREPVANGSDKRRLEVTDHLLRIDPITTRVAYVLKSIPVGVMRLRRSEDVEDWHVQLRALVVDHHDNTLSKVRWDATESAVDKERDLPIAEQTKERRMRPPYEPVELVLGLERWVGPHVVELEEVQTRQLDSRQRWHLHTAMNLGPEVRRACSMNSLGHLGLVQPANNHVIVSIVESSAYRLPNLLWCVGTRGRDAVDFSLHGCLDDEGSRRLINRQRHSRRRRARVGHHVRKVILHQRRVEGQPSGAALAPVVAAAIRDLHTSNIRAHELVAANVDLRATVSRVNGSVGRLRIVRRRLDDGQPCARTLSGRAAFNTSSSCSSSSPALASSTSLAVAAVSLEAC